MVAMQAEVAMVAAQAEVKVVVERAAAAEMEKAVDQVVAAVRQPDPRVGWKVSSCQAAVHQL